MKLTTVIVLACFVAVATSARYEHHPAVDSLTEVDAVQESVQDAPAQEGSLRPKRSLLLLKKKLILGALGLKAAKAAAVGAVLLKAKPNHPIHPTWDLEVHRLWRNLDKKTHDEDLKKRQKKKVKIEKRLKDKMNARLKK